MPEHDEPNTVEDDVYAIINDQIHKLFIAMIYLSAFEIIFEKRT